MTWIKICGITNLEDALIAVDAGADALGFVFYEKSPRNIDPDVARKIVRRLRARIETVGVFVTGSVQHDERMAERIGLSAIQLCAQPRTGPRQPQNLICCEHITKYAALPAKWFFDTQGRYRGFAWPEEFEKNVGAIFLDSSTAKRPGGTGRAFEWKKAVSTVQALQVSFKVVVAGGLTSGNVAEAIRILKPWGVDVSSGVEARPGKKDPDKVRAFIAAVRGADRNH